MLLKGVQADHSELLRKVGVLRALRHHKHLFVEFDDALEHARSHVRRDHAARRQAISQDAASADEPTIRTTPP